MRQSLRFPAALHRTLLASIDHDCLNIAQSAAYSAMVALFPALIVVAAIVSQLPDTTPIRLELAEFFSRILPGDVSPLLDSYFASSPSGGHSTQALLLAFLVSLTGASSVIATLMEGFRRAYDLPPDCWGFWRRRRRAFLLVPLSVIPFIVASLLIVFGHIITEWLAAHLSGSARTSFFIVTLLIRWTVALTGSIGLIALIYHMGIPVRPSVKRVLPGAIVATALWFPSTLAFGWYVTRFANYSQVYGSLGVGIALLFWLYIISFSILCGAEFNVQFHEHFFLLPQTPPPPDMPSHG